MRTRRLVAGAAAAATMAAAFVIRRGRRRQRTASCPAVRGGVDPASHDRTSARAIEAPETPVAPHNRLSSLGVSVRGFRTAAARAAHRARSAASPTDPVARATARAGRRDERLRRPNRSARIQPLITRSWRRRTKATKVVIAVVGFVGTVAGASIGVLTIVDRLDAEKIRITVAATGAYVGPNRGVRSLPVSIVNLSKRQVTLIGGTVRFGGKTMGTTTGLLGGASSSGAPQPVKLLPITIPGESGIGPAVTWRITNLAVATRLLHLRGESRIFHGGPVRGRVELELKFAPDDRRIVVLLDAAANAHPRLVSEAVPGFPHLPDWRSVPLVDSKRRFVGVSVVSRRSDPAVLRLRVFSWPGSRSTAVRKVTTTVLNVNRYEPNELPAGRNGDGEDIQGLAAFRFAPITMPGRFTYVVIGHDGPVAGGVLSSPCPAKLTSGEKGHGELGTDGTSLCVPKRTIGGSIREDP